MQRNRDIMGATNPPMPSRARSARNWPSRSKPTPSMVRIRMRMRRSRSPTFSSRRNRRLMEWRLRRAVSGDAPALSLVAAATFLENFAGTISGPDMVRHCNVNSAPAKFDAWIGDPSCVATLAEHPDGAAPVGYTLLLATRSADRNDERDIELRRIYALSLAQGTGLGHALMTRAIDDAKALGAQPHFAGGIGHQPAGPRFYEREGFELAGTRQFRVGDTIYDDVI